MSFKSEAAKVRSNIAAGKYKEPRDYFGGFVEQVAYGIRKRDEEKRQEELEKRRAARAEARRIAEEQRKADRELKAQEKLINGYLTVKGYDPTDANKAAVRSVVVNLGITGFSDLDAVMKSNSTYLEGTPTGDVNDQMGDLVGTSGTIQFGKSGDKDPLEMSLDEVRFELSDPSITVERRAELERRLESLVGPSEYSPTTLYKPDGSEVIARSLEEETTYLAQGFSLIKAGEEPEFQKRTLYKPDGLMKGLLLLNLLRLRIVHYIKMVLRHRYLTKKIMRPIYWMAGLQPSLQRQRLSSLVLYMRKMAENKLSLLSQRWTQLLKVASQLLNPHRQRNSPRVNSIKMVVK
jgi:hypothetical protein